MNSLQEPVVTASSPHNPSGCDDFDFFGEWDVEGFARLIEEACKKGC
jgi:hypothetical protein